MTLRVYNTLTRKKERFEPLEPGKVRMYVCGPTVYDACHIGHARSVVVFDIIVRYLRATGLDVTYVRNFTDVDDKIIKRANELGVESEVVAERYIKEFYEDMDVLNVKRADKEPRVTEHIEDIIKIVTKLLEKGIAYQIDGDVYYAVEKFKDYGKLSGRKLEDMMAGARVAVNERKQNPFDFALWKAAKPGEPSWDSPWGRGRPGWHIECSAMSFEYLGKTIDIHGGGKDLIFPHHENEIAQSEGVFGKTLARYWIHNGFVNINHEKMSKSLGNFIVIKDVVKLYHPEAVRLFLLSNHYRSPIDFTDKTIAEAGTNLDKLYGLLLRIDEKIDNRTGLPEQKNGGIWKQFCEAMDDDFNTARGIGALFDGVRYLNRRLDDLKGACSPDDERTIQTGRSDISRIGSILGILTESPEAYFDKKRAQALEKESIDPDVIEKMVNDREAARKAKDWSRADQIRKQLEEMNIILEDRPEGTVWKMKY
ncbi:MAG: cysteine--tRNA ligase [Deltaproteobacteria bacterium]|nr:cysteine--tRNA ligase [Deltaproteobacteria bacterium]